MTDQFLPRTSTRSLSADLPRLMRHVTSALTRFLRRRRDRAHLAELPDYLLDDIGLTRADVSRLPPGETLR